MTSCNLSFQTIFQTFMTFAPKAEGTILTHAAKNVQCNSSLTSFCSPNLMLCYNGCFFKRDRAQRHSLVTFQSWINELWMCSPSDPTCFKSPNVQLDSKKVFLVKRFLSEKILHKYHIFSQILFEMESSLSLKFRTLRLNISGTRTFVFLR